MADTQKPTFDDAALKHLEFIQQIVARMGRNSFLLKGWSVTLVAAIFALTANTSSTYFVIVALFPALMFWMLDAYYLRQDRLFRELYKKVIEGKVHAFSMDTSRYLRTVDGWFGTALSPTLLLFHGVVTVVVVAVILVLLFLV